MRLNKSTSHAIRILVDCAEAGDQLVKAVDLSARLDITMQNVFKIVHILSRAELITAMRGRYGGVKLTRPAHEIRIGDIVRAMESTALELEAGERRRDVLVARGVNSVLDSALEAFIRILDQHTLADLATDAKTAPVKRSKRSGKSVSVAGRTVMRTQRSGTGKSAS